MTVARFSFTPRREYQVMGHVMSPTGQAVNAIRELLLEPGQTVPPSLHPLAQVIAPRNGLLAVTTPAATWVVAGPSCAVIIPPGVEHSHRAHARSAVITILLSELASVPDCPDRPVTVTLTSLAQSTLCALSDTARHGDQRLALEYVLQHELFSGRCRDLGPALPAPTDTRLLAMADLMIRYPARQHGLDELASQVGASERTLRRLISAEFAMTFPQWRTLIRVIVSLGYLTEGRSVTATAYECGFTSPSAFIAAFKQILHETPGTYRLNAKSVMLAGYRKTAPASPTSS
jgi:AraC-like DNA-binding protein/quercetin dioxygenase-like cupin family protein